MTDAATQAAAEALDWRNHVFLYADDDALQYHCRWNANGDPDRLRLWQLHYAGVAVAAARPIIEAEVRDAIAAEIEAKAAGSKQLWQLIYVRDRIARGGTS